MVDLYSKQLELLECQYISNEFKMLLKNDERWIKVLQEIMLIRKEIMPDVGVDDFNRLYKQASEKNDCYHINIADLNKLLDHLEKDHNPLVFEISPLNREKLISDLRKELKVYPPKFAYDAVLLPSSPILDHRESPAGPADQSVMRVCK